MLTTSSNHKKKKQNPSVASPSSAATAIATTTSTSFQNTGTQDTVAALPERRKGRNVPSRRYSGLKISTTTSGTTSSSDHHGDRILHPDDVPVGRSVRGNSQQQQHHVPISEIAMTKEFLINGKLHKAVTFGLDIPSLLYSDANGRTCGIPDPPPPPQQHVSGSMNTSDQHRDNTKQYTDDEILAARLYNTKILLECELDYNRVVGHRMVKALIPRTDFGSAIVQTILTEIMAGCVLTPIMGLFSPDTISSWIVMGLSPASKSSTTTATTTPIASNNPTTSSSGKDVAAAAAGSLSTEIVRDGKKGTDPLLSQPEECIDTSIEVSKTEDEEIRLLQRPRARSDDSIGLTQPNEESPAKHHQDPLSLPNSPSTPANSKVAYGSPGALPAVPSALSTTDTTTINSNNIPGDGMTNLLTMALIDLQQFMDFDDCRVTDDPDNYQQQSNVDWEGDSCRAAIVRLVLVIEAALLHGRCTYKIKNDVDDVLENTDEFLNDLNDSEMPVEVTLPEYESTSLTQILMEMTGDIDAFEQRVASEDMLMRQKIVEQFENRIPLAYHPTSTEISSLRTLIAAWLESGQIYRTVTLLVQSYSTVLAPYYNKAAFLRTKDNANGFVRQLRSLENVKILVDTIAVLSSPRLEDTSISVRSSRYEPRSSHSPEVTSPRNAEHVHGDPASIASMMSLSFKSTTSIPRHLDFNRNESFATSLRSERERRMQSWDRMVREEMEGGLPIVYRSRGSSKDDAVLHKELHHIAMLFYYETVLLSIRDASRRANVEADIGSHHSVVSSLDSDRITPFSLLTVEAVCPKRRLEIPDDDSSFLLRGQPRVLNAVGVHRDPRNHDHSYKSFAANIEEIAKNEHYTGGRYLRRCLIRYYPSDRTASVDSLDDARKLDQRKGSIPDTITLGHSIPTATPLLSDEFMNNRYLCQRWVPKGTTRSQSLLASGTMEGSDFTLVPRAGKAIEFVYRMSYYERPMVDLSGKHFAVLDSISLGVHRADASALELSDASLSVALEIVAADTPSLSGQRQRVEMGKDGYPVVWLKSNRKQDDVHVEAKSYR
jgi:PXA domain